MRATSIEAYRDITSSGMAESLKDRVYRCLVKNASTIREVCESLKITPNVCSPRVNELYKEGRISLLGKRQCKVSNRTAIEWGVGEQGNLF
jgi:predicted DNA-binding transcriptional regulator